MDRYIKVDEIEVANYLTLTLFSAAIHFAINKADEIKAIISYISGSVTLTLLLAVICYHMFTELCVPLWRRFKQRTVAHNDYYSPVETQDVNRDNADSAEPTFTVIDGQPLVNAAVQ